MSLLAEIRAAKKQCLQLSRKVPTRQCSPYGHLDTDSSAVMEVGRLAFEALQKAEARISKKKKKKS